MFTNSNISVQQKAQCLNLIKYVSLIRYGPNGSLVDNHNAASP